MKVILTEDVYKKGVAGEVVVVANGYARNYLIPQRLAVKATAGAFKQSTALREQATKRREERNLEMAALAEKLEALTLAFPVKASETGKLYGSVTNGHISEAIEAELSIVINQRRIGEKSLRELGEHSVAVRLSTGYSANIRVLVHREDEAPESALGITPDIDDDGQATDGEAELYAWEEFDAEDAIDDTAAAEDSDEAIDADDSVVEEASQAETEPSDSNDEEAE